MVRLINDVIKAAVEAHEAIYVDVDRLFEGHRFCEEVSRSHQIEAVPGSSTSI